MKLWRNEKLANVFSQFRTYVHGCLPSFYVEVEVIAECIKGTVRVSEYYYYITGVSCGGSNV